MSTRVASVNVRFTLSDMLAEACVRKVLKDSPDVVALQEWGKDRDHILQRIAREGVYEWTRPQRDGGPVMWKVSRYRLRSCRAVRLARREFVGRLPGRKSTLPASYCTEVLLDDLQAKGDGLPTVVENFHLTAEVEDVRGGGGYKTDGPHRLRVRRHRREKRRLGKRSRMHKRRSRRVFAVGDSNDAGMKLGGFVNCWTDRSGGTLQGRAVDIVFADRKPLKLWTVETASDHDALVCTYA